MHELFYSNFSERPSQRLRRERRAKTICSKCSVLLECRSYARTNPEYGIWGGETEDERYVQGFRVPYGSKAEQRRRTQLLKESESKSGFAAEA
jgi:WhiB family redox-sensing transcriptional regulator